MSSCSHRGWVGLEGVHSWRMGTRGRHLLFGFNHHSLVDSRRQTSQGLRGKSSVPDPWCKPGQTMEVHPYGRESGRHSYPYLLYQLMGEEQPLVVGAKILLSARIRMAGAARGRGDRGRKGRDSVTRQHPQQTASNCSGSHIWKMQAELRLLWGKYESAKKGLRITALFFWGVSRLLSRRQRPQLEPWSRRLNPMGQPQVDVSQAEESLLEWLVREDQNVHLSIAIKQIRSGQAVTGPYACWRLHLDIKGILRINGRLAANKTVPESARQPIFLTSDMPMAYEIARLHHERLQHAGGAQHLLSEIRQTWWIHRGLKVAKTTLKQCAWCQSRKARQIAQSTAPLHYTRLNAPKGRVFFSIGIDMFGPMEVTQGRGRPRGKRYGLIFTCGFSRAINVEVMRDATAESCYLAFKRHVAIYGQPEFINSDQGTNLQYVRKILHEEGDSMGGRSETNFRVNFPRIQWVLNPPYSPSYGGHYESLIKVLKNTF